MKKFILSIFSLSFCLLSSAQVSLSFRSSGSCIANFQVSNINFNAEIQFDTSQNFNTPLLRTKISKGSWTDTVMGLKLGRTYYFRSRQVQTDGVPRSGWSNTQYTTANYPFSNLYNSGKYTNILQNPTHKFIHPYDPKLYFWTDVSPSFNSPRLQKFTRAASDYTPIFVNLYKEHDTLYIRSKVVDQTDSLPWKDLMLIADFRPVVSYGANAPCTDSNTYRLNVNGYIYTSFTNNNITYYIVQNSGIDSFKSSNFFNNYNLSNNDPIKIITKGYLYEDTFSTQFTDTLIISDPIDLSKPLGYNMQNQVITFYTYTCNKTTVELQLHQDTNFNSLINTQTAGTSSSSNQISFTTTWDPFTSQGLRYRVNRLGIWGPWINFSNQSYVPKIIYSGNIGIDTSTSKWTITRVNPTNKMLEIELDNTLLFNSVKKKSYLINDASSYNLESLFGLFNYSRCRVVIGTYKSPWSNTVSKNFVKDISNCYLSFSHPDCSYTIPFSMYFSGAEIQVGYSAKSLPIHINKVNSVFQDTFKFKDKDTVYFRIRRYTPIDTCSWSPVFKSLFRSNSFICATPKIIYNGFRNQLDTFHVVWIDKNSYIEGAQLMFGPRSYDFRGIIDVPAGVNRYIIKRSDYPAGWWFAVYPKCSSTRSYSSVLPGWYMFNGQKIGIDQSIDNSLVYFSQDRQCLVNPGESEFDFIVYDQVGHQVYQGHLNAYDRNDLPDLSTGVYHIILNNTFQNYSHLSIVIE